MLPVLRRLCLSGLGLVPLRGGKAGLSPRSGAPGVQCGHRLSLPGHLFAGLVLGVEAAEKKLRIGNGQPTWRKAVGGGKGENWGATPQWTGF